MDLWVEKNYENSKVKFNVTSELSSDSFDLSDQKLKWKSLIHWMFLDQNGVHNLIRTENMVLWSKKIMKNSKVKFKCYLKTSFKLDRFESSTQMKELDLLSGFRPKQTRYIN